MTQGSEELEIFRSQPNTESRGSGFIVQMRIPFSPRSQPTVQFLKQGSLDERELAVFSAVLKSANLITAENAAAAAQVGPCLMDGCCHHITSVLS